MIEFIRGMLGFLFLLSFAIFIHELGHFMFAKLFKVRVETFSIGFGKKFFTFRRGETEYALSIIPFGGYVKMAGVVSREMEEILKGDKPATPAEHAQAELLAAELEAPAPAESTTKPGIVGGIAEEVNALRAKPYWQKLLILSAGCINNFLTAITVYFLMYFFGVYVAPDPPAVIGTIDGIAEQVSPIKLQDQIVSVAGKPVDGYLSFQENLSDAALDKKARGAIPVQVVRDGTTVSVELPRRAPVDPTLPEGMIIEVNNRRVSSFEGAAREAGRLLQNENLDPIPVKIAPAEGQIQEVRVPPLAATGPLWPLYVYDPHQPAYVEMLQPNLPAERSGIKSGDMIKAINGIEIASANHATRVLRRLPNQEVTITLLRAVPGSTQKEERQVKLTVRPNPENPKLGQIGVLFGDGPRTEVVRKPFGESIRLAVRTAIRTAKVYWEGIQTLLRSSFQTLRENVAGPIGIGRQAYVAANMDLMYYFWLFAGFNLILGLTNLLPIPVLDGGHIVFATIEAIIRRPVPAKLELIILNLFTFLIIGLALAITFNDVLMNWWALVPSFLSGH